jgi:hypothetical protein
MVFSKINGEVEYKEMRGIDPEDRGYESTLYEVGLFDKDIVITLGKPKYTFAKYHIIYYPIYVVNVNNGIEGQLGVFEIEDSKVLKLLDKEGDVDIGKLGNPLLYEFAERSVRQSKSDVGNYLLQWDKKSTKAGPEVGVGAALTESADDLSDDLPDDIDDLFIHRPSPEEKGAKEFSSAKKILEKGVFITDTEVKQPPLLPEEGEEDANKIRKTYKETAKQPWIQKFMKNTNYRIHEVETNGDCFFAVIRDAYKQIGQNTTVDKLRAIVATAATDSIFREHKQLYNDLEGNIRDVTAEMAKVKKLLEKDMKKRANDARDNKEELAAVLKEVETLKQQYKDLKVDKAASEENISVYLGDLKAITNVDEFRKYIMTSSYWADSWAVSVLERELSVKLIIFSELSYKEKALDSVLSCGEVDSDIESRGQFLPSHYIMASYSGSHYRLISYKDKKIFTFREIPYHVKILITNKCMERNSGVFHLIQDFRNFNSRLGVEVDEGPAGVDVGAEDAEINKYGDLYDGDIVFMFHSASQKTPKPGKGSGEKIPADKVAKYVNLGKIEDWRRKLDDSWDKSPFTVGGKRWLSVEHYYQAAKFKKGFPDFYEQFTVESESDISKDVDLAKIAGSKTGVLKKKGGDTIVRPKSIIIDSDFYGQKRNESEREMAVRAKFTQNLDLKEMLKATKPAKLIHFLRGHEPEIDHILMTARNELE